MSPPGFSYGDVFFSDCVVDGGCVVAEAVDCFFYARVEAVESAEFAALKEVLECGLAGGGEGVSEGFVGGQLIADLGRVVAGAGGSWDCCCGMSTWAWCGRCG